MFNSLKTKGFVLLLAASLNAGAQCTNSSIWSTATVSAPGTTIQVSGCTYAGEYNQINGIQAGYNLISYSSVNTDYITIRQGSPSGAVVASGTTPLSWVAPSSTTYYEHINTNSSCGVQSQCRDTYLVNKAGCGNTAYYTSTVAPAPGTSVQVSNCTYAGEYNTITSVNAGQIYISSTSVPGDYITIRQGSSLGVIIASGTTPLTWTATVGGTYYEHINTSSSCGASQTCRNTYLSNITVVNDLCANATTLAVGSGTSGTTVNSTLESPAPPVCGTALNQPGVWYKVTGNGNKLGASLCATSGWDSKIFVFAGSCGAFTCVAGIDDNGPLCSGTPASATWCSVPGTIYHVLVTGYNTPSAFSLSITQTLVPAITASSGSVCAGNSFTIIPSGAITYTYSGGSNIVTPGATTSYTVRGTGSSGCPSQTPAIVTVSVLPRPVITVNSGSVCSGSSFTITPSGASSYTYQGGSNIVSPSSTTSYTVMGTGANGCLSASAAVAGVTVMSRPAISVNSGTVCSGKSFTLSPSGAVSYTYSGGSSIVSPVSNTSYSITGTGANGCVSSSAAIATVSVAASPTITVNSGSICAGSSFTIQASGAASYTYAGGSNVVSPASNTSYTVSGTGANGCVSASPAISSVTVMSAPSIVAVASATAVCPGVPVNLTAGGASTYSWSSGATGANTSVTPTVSAVYSVTGTANGCSSTYTLSVDVLPGPTITVNSGSLCAGSVFTLTPSGATSYTFSSGSNTVSPVANATYSVSGTHTNGCTSAAPAIASITVVQIPTVTVIMSSTAICVGGSVNLTAGGALTYSWSNGALTATTAVSPVSSAVYTVTGALGGCTGTNTAAVLVSPMPTVSISGALPVICAGESLSLTASGAQGYAWTGGGTGAVLVITPTLTTSYSVTGTNPGGCSAGAAVTQSVTECTGMAEAATRESFLLYPNPGYGVFTVECRGIAGSRLDVTDLTGRVVFSKRLEDDRSAVDLSHLANGVYQVKFSSAAATFAVKLVKQ